MIDRLVGAWSALVAITLLSSFSGALAGSAGAATLAFAVLGMAFAKVWIVMHSFMDIRNAPFLLRALCVAWLLLVLGILLAIYSGLIE